jgi:heme exporter protein C
MRNRILLLLTVAFGALISWNLKNILLGLPDEARQDAIYRILYFHAPAAIVGLLGFGVGMVFSGVYLATKNFFWDTLAAATTEVSLVLAAINLVTGSIWGRQQWGVWWAWDARLTSMLVCWLIFAGYLMLRRAIDEPDTRARLSAVLSLFGTVNAWFVYKVIEWFPRLQHPGPVLSFRTGGKIDRQLELPFFWMVIAYVLLGTILVMIRMRQESVSREIDSLRRLAHA